MRTIIGALLTKRVTMAEIEDLADALGALPSDLRYECLEAVVTDLSARTVIAEALAALDRSVEQRRIRAASNARREAIGALCVLAEGTLKSLARSVQDQWNEITANRPVLRRAARVRLAKRESRVKQWLRAMLAKRNPEMKVLAVISLLFWLPGRVEIVERLANARGEHWGGAGRVIAEPVDGEPVPPIPEADWGVKSVWNVGWDDEFRVSVARTLHLDVVDESPEKGENGG